MKMFLNHMAAYPEKLAIIPAAIAFPDRHLILVRERRFRDSLPISWRTSMYCYTSGKNTSVTASLSATSGKKLTRWKNSGKSRSSSPLWGSHSA